MNKKIFIYDLDRTLLIFLLLLDPDDEVMYITTDDKKKKIENLAGEKFYISKTKLNNSDIKIEKEYIEKLRKKFKEKINNIEKGKVELYGLDQWKIARRIFYNESINIIEEGTKNYFYEVEMKNIKAMLLNLKRRIFNWINGIKERNKVMGYGDKIKNIYLTTELVKVFGIPKGLKNKSIQVISLKNLWERKSEKFKNEIVDIFGFDKKILERKNIENIVLLTQPLSEDFDFTEEEQVKLYMKIVKKYPKERLIIKPHPRDKVDYLKYFNEYYIVNAEYPIEFWSFFNIKIDRIVTLFSSGVYGVGDENTKIDIYGIEVDKRLEKIFKNYNKLVKRNSFL